MAVVVTKERMKTYKNGRTIKIIEASSDLHRLLFDPIAHRYYEGFVISEDYWNKLKDVVVETSVTLPVQYYYCDDNNDGYDDYLDFEIEDYMIEENAKFKEYLDNGGDPDLYGMEG